ncbi:MAG: hypothetical protein DDT22_00944 [candidate division WS2 bacterium]|nr:hypothetical protein [Bacillota bacterium]MBT9175270.1 hypothetical protein [Candidatus Lithacetigena glycinireducens]
MKIKPKINKLICRRCTYQWVQKATKFYVCPECKTPYWESWSSVENEKGEDYNSEKSVNT